MLGEGGEVMGRGARVAVHTLTTVRLIVLNGNNPIR